MTKKRILSIDGGGIKGVVPAVVLFHLEKHLKRLSNNPNSRIHDYFDLFAGAILPGLMLVVLFIIFIFFYARFNPLSCPPVETNRTRNEIYLEAAKSVIPPITLIVLVLGSILFGIATPTESASVGAVGAAIIALLKGELNFNYN